MTECKYKVGDKVRLINWNVNAKSNLGDLHNKLKVGNIYIIGDKWYNYHFSSGYSTNVYRLQSSIGLDSDFYQWVLEENIQPISKQLMLFEL